jgi:hypothetical protein
MPVIFDAGLRSKEFEGKLRIFSSSLGGIFKELMAATGREMVAEARSRAGAAFTSRTGNLLRHIKFIVTDTGGVLTTRDSLKKYKSSAYYSLFVEKGANIKPRNKKYLRFKINGEWKRVESVKLKPRPFMGPVFDEYWDGEHSKGYRALADALRRKLNEELG